MEDLSKYCCQNEKCPNYGQRGLDNLTVCGYYGKGKRFKLLYCRTCRVRFSERKGTTLFKSRLPMEKVESILSHIREGCGVRKTARLTGVDKNTVTRYSKFEGEHSKNLHDDLVPFSPQDARGAIR